jgi:uncharacterized protein YegP (UPF0339 family)
MAGKFELIKDARGEFRFHLKEANGEIIGSSEGYKSKASAENGIKSVQPTRPVPQWSTRPGSALSFWLARRAHRECVDLTTRRLATMFAD